jgi:hypothetical protein
MPGRGGLDKWSEGGLRDHGTTGPRDNGVTWMKTDSVAAKKRRESKESGKPNATELALGLTQIIILGFLNVRRCYLAEAQASGSLMVCE